MELNRRDSLILLMLIISDEFLKGSNGYKKIK